MNAMQQSVNITTIKICFLLDSIRTKSGLRVRRIKNPVTGSCQTHQGNVYIHMISPKPALLQTKIINHKQQTQTSGFFFQKKTIDKISYLQHNNANNSVQHLPFNQCTLLWPLVSNQSQVCISLDVTRFWDKNGVLISWSEKQFTCLSLFDCCDLLCEYISWATLFWISYRSVIS